MGDRIKKFDGGGEVDGSGFAWGLAQEMANPEIGMISDAQYTDRIISMIEDGYYYGQTPEQLAADDLGLSVAEMNGRTEEMLDSILNSQVGEDGTGFVNESARLSAEGILKGKIAQAGVIDPVAQKAALNSAMESLEGGASGLEAVKAAAGGAKDYVEELLKTAKDIIDKGYDATIGKLPEILTPESILIDPTTGQTTTTFEIGDTGGFIPGATSPIFGSTVGTVGGGTNVGIMTTGNAVLDAIIKGAKDGVDGQDIEDIVSVIIAGNTGIPADIVGAGVQGAKEAINAAGAVVASKVTAEADTDIIIDGTTKICDDGSVIGINETCPEDITTLIGGDGTGTGDSTLTGPFQEDPCDDPAYAAANQAECGGGGDPCDDPAYAAANPIKCAVTIVEEKDCTDPEYAAANPIECAVTIVEEKDCTDPEYAAANPIECGTSVNLCDDPAYAAANPVKCGTTGGDPCDDPAYAASRPGECGTIGGDPCDDPAYAAANPAECGVVIPDEDTPGVPKTTSNLFGVRTKPGEKVELENFFDIGGTSIFDQGTKTLEQEDPLAFLYSGYADGGIVQDYDIEELIRFLENQRG